MALPGASSSESFTYSAPADWIDRPLTEMRAVRLQVGESATDECTVTVLDGDGGGALANINRWCGQINAKPWMQAQLDSAPRISMFKAEALLVTLGEENSPRMVLGALARMGTSSVFVKFAGARETVLARRQDFETFCTSLAQKP